MCLAQVIGMLGVFAFPALLPHFRTAWALSTVEAGWINGIYFAGYTLAVPLLTGITDRIDARGVYFTGCLVGIFANIGFALVADGFWWALLFRALSGLGLAGTFVPGLKALIDRLQTPVHQRAISFYTACFGLGMSVSFYCAGALFELWNGAFVFEVAALGSAVALLVALMVLRPKPVPSREHLRPLVHMPDFRPVWRNRSGRIYILAYACHMWEMSAARSWLVAFLTFSISRQSLMEGHTAPTTVMAVAGVGGMVASIVGGELAIKYGRRKFVISMMVISCLLAFTIGFCAHLPYAFVIVVCFVYTLFFQGDSAAIHGGVIASAEPDRRGATMALQSFGGFAAASMGSVVAGWVLDASGGGTTTLSWGLTFASLGLVAALGPLGLLRLEGHFDHVE